MIYQKKSVSVATFGRIACAWSRNMMPLKVCISADVVTKEHAFWYQSGRHLAGGSLLVPWYARRKAIKTVHTHCYSLRRAKTGEPRGPPSDESPELSISSDTVSVTLPLSWDWHWLTIRGHWQLSLHLPLYFQLPSSGPSLRQVSSSISFIWLQGITST
jgi:hypothetical protein